jgi:hypothetical protein
MPVTVRNAGGDIWPDPSMADPTQPGAYAVRLTYRWISRGVPTDWLERFELSRPVLPGEEVTFRFAPKAPDQRGRFELELDLVQELVAHFRERGSPGPRLRIEVR